MPTDKTSKKEYYLNNKEKWELTPEQKTKKREYDKEYKAKKRLEKNRARKTFCKWCGLNIENPKTNRGYHKGCYYLKEKRRHQEYRGKNKESIKNYRKEYSKRNRERCIEATKRWRLKNRGKIKEWRDKNKDNINFRQREYYKNHSIKIKAMAKKTRARNKDTISKYNKEDYLKNPQKHFARGIAYKKVKIPVGTRCLICKIKLANERHHEDYKKPLEVTFLCSKCHKLKHPKIRIIN